MSIALFQKKAMIENTEQFELFSFNNQCIKLYNIEDLHVRFIKTIKGHGGSTNQNINFHENIDETDKHRWFGLTEQFPFGSYQRNQVQKLVKTLTHS